MKKGIRRASLLTILLITAVVFVVSPVFASLGSWSYHLFGVNISGTSDAYSGKMVSDPAGSTWIANIVTYVDNPPISLYLGWNWFSGTEKCGYTTTQNIQGGSYYAYTQQRADTIYLTAQPCGSTRYGLSSGKHIVTSGTSYYDTWTQTEVIP
ncbi:MAG: hypothetical protein U5K99_07485 [Anaerolineales bacterium]|nr:hypothetical protein [Anaerolineales bacterium]